MIHTLHPALGRSWKYLVGAALVLGGLHSRPAFGFAFIFAGEGNEDRVTHPLGYTGAGGVINITVGINPANTHAAASVIPVRNLLNTWNNLTVTTGNLVSDFVNIPFGQFDFESVMLHEMGHSLGLAHVNLASESGIVDLDDRNYTKTTDGANNVFDLDDGADNIIGSADDLRGDDVNLNYFKTADNNPFTIAGTVDSTTYSRDLADLPGGDTWSANPDRAVGADLGFANSEAVMQQGTFNNEIQRTLGADDVAGLRYAMSGIDEIAGNADDYTINLIYAGLTTSAQIVFGESNSGFAVSSSTGSGIGGDHLRITTNSITYNRTSDWFFNDTLSFTVASGIPEPSTATLWILGLVLLRKFGRPVRSGHR